MIMTEFPACSRQGVTRDDFHVITYDPAKISRAVQAEETPIDPQPSQDRSRQSSILRRLFFSTRGNQRGHRLGRWLSVSPVFRRMA